MRISVIVPTYNRPAALRLCLLSLARQSTMPHEIIIADDGSGPETEKVVRMMQESLKESFQITHVWQEDIGFRKPCILNEAVRQSSGDYLIFIDGDCMAHRNFVQAHVEYSSPDAALSGKRVEIGNKLTEWVLQSGTVMNRFNLRLLRDSARNDPSHSRRVAESIPIKNKMLRRLMHRDRITPDGLWGCNFSIPRDLFIAINGCDEDFLDGSVEDNDIGIRVQNLGKKLRSVRGLAIVFHLWHKSTWNRVNDKYRHNMAILQSRIENKVSVCRNGINTL